MTSSSLVLIVEDEPKIAAILEDYLSQVHYRTHWIAHGDEVEEWCQRNNPDVVLLDVMLPGKDGLTICRELRSWSSVPIVMLTARIEEIDRLLGLELGADDYICKPFSPKEVTARVKALLRRVALIRDGSTDDYRGLSLDESRFQARLDGAPLDLTPVEFRLLATMARNPGIVFSRDQLITQIYDDGRIVSDRTVDSHVKNLRHKLDAIDPERDLIRSIYGVGYKLE